MGNRQLTLEDPGQGLPVQRGPRGKSEAAREGEQGSGQASAQDTTLLCRYWARYLCLRTRGISGGKGAEGQAARAARSSLKAPHPTRWTRAGPTLPRNRRDL